MTWYVFVLSILLCLPVSSFAKTLGTVGKTYPFAEKDALSEVEARAKQVDWTKKLAELKGKVVKFRPEIIQLPRVIANRVRLVDPTYTLDVDVPDPHDLSRVLYPKGFTFNPLQYMNMPGCVVFVNAGDHKQLAWLKKSLLSREATAKILLTGGDLGQLEQTFGRPLFFADSILVERFDIMAVPSVVCQKGVSLEVQEILP